MKLRTRSEEGQVYPALLVACILGFASALLFVSLQNLLDQTGRAATASDAAALGAATEHRNQFESVFTGGLSALQALLDFLAGQGSLPSFSLNAAAASYAEDNGAQLTGPVQLVRFNAIRREWTYRVTTRQNDTVQDQNSGSSARSESTSTVTVRLAGGLCTKAGLPGLRIDGECRTIVEFVADCVEPPPPEPSTPPDEPDPTEPSEPPEPWEPGDWCSGLSLADALDWDIELVNS